MLNGIAPIILFRFFPEPPPELFQTVQGIPSISTLVSRIGIPIPIYLDKSLTGIVIDSESKALDVEEQIVGTYDAGKEPVVIQRQINNIVSVNMIARRDSIFLTLFLAINDLIFDKLIRQTYSITYLNGPTTVFNGRLHSFTATPGTDDDLYHITMQINKGSGKTIQPNLVGETHKTTGVTP